jgi:hypothetical protein
MQKYHNFSGMRIFDRENHIHLQAIEPTSSVPEKRSNGRLVYKKRVHIVPQDSIR